MSYTKINPTEDSVVTTYLGTSGNDSVVGGLTLTSDVFIGGQAGNDTNTFANQGTNFSNHTIKGGLGNDKISFGNSTSNLVNSFVNTNKGDDNVATNGLSSSTLLGGQGSDTFSTGKLTSTRLNGNKGDDYIDVTGGLSSSNLFGGQGNDNLFVSGIVDTSTTRGDLGEDVITVRNSTTNVNHTINGNVGNDTVNVNAITSFTGSQINGGLGNDSVNANASTVGIVANGDAGTDSLAGGSGADNINGGDGSDTIQGEDGADSLSGNSGDDFFVYDATTEVTGDTLLGGTTGETNGDTIVVNGANVDFKGLTSATILTAASVSNIRIDGANSATFNGTQITGQAININDNAAGNATLDVDVADATAVDLSTLTFTAVTGTAFASGNDIIDIDATNAAAAATITGTTINDNIQGNDEADTLLGNTGNDTFGDSGGNDTITGGAGADAMTFTTGDDTSVYLATNEIGDSITGFTAGGANDLINFGATIFDGANYTSEATFGSRIALAAIGGAGTDTTIATGDLIVNNTDSTSGLTTATVDALLATQNGTFDGGALFMSDNGNDTFLFFDSDVNNNGLGADVSLIATFVGVADANSFVLADFLIT